MEFSCPFLPTKWRIWILSQRAPTKTLVRVYGAEQIRKTQQQAEIILDLLILGFPANSSIVDCGAWSRNWRWIGIIGSVMSRAVKSPDCGYVCCATYLNKSWIKVRFQTSLKGRGVSLVTCVSLVGTKVRYRAWKQTLRTYSRPTVAWTSLFWKGNGLLDCYTMLTTSFSAGKRKGTTKHAVIETLESRGLPVNTIKTNMVLRSWRMKKHITT